MKLFLAAVLFAGASVAQAQSMSLAEIISMKALKPFQEEPEIAKSPEVFNTYSQENADFIRSMSAVSCAQVGKFKKELKGIFITYEDGDQQIVVPVDAVEKNGKIEFSYFPQLPGWTPDIKVEKRKVFMKNGQLIYEGIDGEKFPIKKLQITDARKFLHGEKEDSYEDKLCMFRSKSRELANELKRKSGEGVASSSAGNQ